MPEPAADDASGSGPSTRTRDARYAERLARLGGARWKRWLDVQAPYRWNLRRLEPGFVLDLGCGLGRNLLHLGGNGVGIDHNQAAVAEARARGLEAYTPETFRASAHARDGCFDSLLCAHVVEHMRFEEAAALLAEHVRFVRPEGQIVLIAPQEAGFASDPTHAEFMGPDRLQALLEHCGATLDRAYSFPFPRVAGRVFPHNEFVAVGRLPR